MRSWRPGPDGDTFLVRRCQQLRRTDLTEFAVEDLRIMLAQQIAVPILLPRALGVLMRSPLSQGDHYPGDLLHVVLILSVAAWDQHLEARRQLAVLINSAMSMPRSSWPQPAGWPPTPPLARSSGTLAAETYP